MSKEKIFKMDREDMSPIDFKAAQILVFKRKNTKDHNNTQKSDFQATPQVITIQDETVDEGDTEQPTKMILSGTPIIPSTQLEEIVQSPTVEATVQSPVSSSS